MEKTIIRHRYAFIVLSLLFALGTTATLSADDWVPQLNPSYYSDNGDSDVGFDEAMGDAFAERYVPDRLPTSRTREVRQLPAPPRKRIVRRSAASQVGFDAPLEPNEVILPQGFLEEGSSGGANPLPKPKSVKTTPPKRTVETDVYDDQVYEEYYVDEYPAMNRRPLSGLLSGGAGVYMAETEYPGGVEHYGEVYDNGLSAMSNCYLGPPIVKPFGTGLLDNLTVFGGATGFKSELDGGYGGNFGFTEGVNWSVPVTHRCNISGQLGFRAVQADVNGSPVSNKSCRNQYFVTGGFFYRDPAVPIQGGFVYDWFQDEYFGSIEVEQIRVELSARTFSNLEYGFLGGFGTSKRSNAWINAREDAYRNTVDVRYRLRSDQYYLLFGRKHFASGGMAEIRAGATDRGDVILGASGEFPINDNLILHGGVTLSIPEESRHQGAWRRETWDVSVGVVYHFRGGACSKSCNPCRPMFDVAGNGSFMNRIR